MPGPLHRLLNALNRRPLPGGENRQTPATAAEQPVPTLAAQAEALSAPLPPLLAEARRLAATIAAGLHGHHRTGSGEDFWQFRPYDRGDPATLIDWRQSARRQQAYIRQREWTVAQTVTLWCGTHAGLHWRSGPELPEKITHARLLILALAALLLRGGERISLLTPEEATPPVAGGQAALHRIATHLCQAVASDTGLPPAPELPRHSLAVLVSDFLMPVDALAPLLRRMAGLGIRGHLVQVLDPAEDLFPFNGRIRFQDTGNTTPDLLVPRCEDLKDAYLARLAAHRSALNALCRYCGWQLTFHRTDRPLTPALLALYQALSTRRNRPV